MSPSRHQDSECPTRSCSRAVKFPNSDASCGGEAPVRGGRQWTRCATRLPQGSKPDSAAVQQAIRLLDLRLGLVACMQPAVGNRQRPCQSLWAPTADMEQGRSSCTPVITSQWTGRPSALPHLPRQRTARRGLAPFQVHCLLPVGRANPGCARRFPINGVVPGPCPARFPDPGCPIRQSFDDNRLALSSMLVPRGRRLRGAVSCCEHCGSEHGERANGRLHASSLAASR